MKFLRLQLPRLFLNEIGLKELFSDIKSLEILTAYQYDQKNFFSMQRITFTPGIIEKMGSNEIREYVIKKFGAKTFELVEKTGNSVLSIMNQTRSSGFWPATIMGPWAFLFPLVVSDQSILLSLMVEEQYLNPLKESLEKFVGHYDILAQSSFEPADGSEQSSRPGRGMFNMPLPRFTLRQQEIAMYSARQGYFESPKRISADDIANNFKITVSAVNENLRKAEQLAMKYFFGETGKI